MQRVQKTGGSYATEIVYFSDHPIALLNPANNTWTTDLIWAGKNLLAEVPGSQTGSPIYRLLDHEGNLAATTTSAGGVIASSHCRTVGNFSLKCCKDAKDDKSGMDFVGHPTKASC